MARVGRDIVDHRRLGPETRKNLSGPVTVVLDRNGKKKTLNVTRKGK